MKNRNCPNCGAAIEICASKCPYCGTSYFDFSNIDVDDRKPIYLKVKHGNGVFVVPVIMRSLSITNSFGEDLSIEMEFTGLTGYLN